MKKQPSLGRTLRDLDLWSQPRIQFPIHFGMFAVASHFVGFLPRVRL